MPHHRWCRLLVLCVVALVGAPASATVSPPLADMSLRSQCLNSGTSQPPYLLHHLTFRAVVTRLFSAGSSNLSLTPSISSAAIAWYRCFIALCTSSLSAPHQLYLEEGYCQIPRCYADVRGLLECLRHFSLCRRTRQCHIGKWILALDVPWECPTAYASPFLASPDGHQRHMKLTRVLQGKTLSLDGGNTAESEAVCNCDRMKALRRGCKYGYMHPLSIDARWKTTAFLAAPYTQASCPLTAQRLATTLGGATIRSLLRCSQEAKALYQLDSLLGFPEALRHSGSKALPRANNFVPVGQNIVDVERGKSSTRARLKCSTSSNEASSRVRRQFQRVSSVGQGGCDMRRLSLPPEQSKWKTLPTLKPEQPLRTPMDDPIQKPPVEGATDVDSAKNAEREHVVNTLHQIITPRIDVEQAAPALGASEQLYVDQVLLGRKRGRLTVTLSNNHVHACVVDNRMQRTYAYASSFDRCLLPEIGAIQRRRGLNPRPHGGTMKAAWAVGRLVAQRALAKGIRKVFFDRKGYRYIGRVKALADGAREGGLDF